MEHNNKLFKRTRNWFKIPANFQPGPRNAITDVEGVTADDRGGRYCWMRWLP